MPAGTPNARRTQLSLSSRSIALIVLTVAATAAFIAIVEASVRVLGWMAAAAAMAALLEPLVDFLARRMKRGLAVFATLLLVLGSVGGLAYLTVSDIAHEVGVLQRAAPERARQLEESDRFGSAARAFDLEAKTRSAVKEIPDRLRGGSNADALRSAGTRGVAYLATTVLTVFLVLNGRKLVLAALGQIRDADLRAVAHNALRDGGKRGVEYVTGSLGMAALAGLMVSIVARLVDVPGAVPLGLWAAVWDLVPVLGAVIGALPVAVLAAATSPAKGIFVLAFFVLYEVAESVLVQRRLEKRTVHVGPFLTVVTGSVGLELYGLGGALFALFATSIAVAVFEAWRSEASGNT